MKKSIFKKLGLLAVLAIMLVALMPTPVLAAIPSSPSNLIAITVNGGRVDLHWTDNSADETGFNVERAEDVGALGPGTYVHIGPTPTVAANTLVFADTTTSAQLGYWYRVSAVNGSGTSLPSNEVRIITPLSAPQISLASSAALRSGGINTIEATATDAGATVASAEYQFIANEATGTFIAHDIYSTQMDLTILAPRAAAPVANTAAMPVGLPAGAIAEFEIRGTVSAVNTGTGEWQIGTPPLRVYESVTGQPQSTRFVGSRAPIVGDAVKVIAYRTAASGPLVAKEIRFIQAAQPAGTPALLLSFLINGAVTVIEPAVTAPGYLISGETWTVGTGNFRIDDVDFPAYIDVGIGVGMNVTVRFATRPAQANIARQIMTQIPPTLLTTKNANPVFDNTPIPTNVPPGTFLYMIIDGVCQAVDHNTGEWTMGLEGVKAYEHGLTWVMQHPIINWPPGVGDELLLYGKRTLTPGPIVLDEVYMILQGPLYNNPPKGTAVEPHLMYNGVIQAMGPNTWTVGGQTFIVDDPEGKARIDPLPMPAFTLGMSVTVEFDHVGEVIPDNANWAPLTLDVPTNKWTGASNLPAVPAGLAGTLFLRVTDNMQAGSTTATAATLATMPSAVPAAPTNLAAAVVNGSQVNLTWTDASNNEDNFRIERAPDVAGNPGTWATLTTTNANVTAFSDTTVAPNTIYHYRAFGVNVLGSSVASNVVLATTTPPPAKIVFTTSARTANSGIASPIITIQTQDAVNNPANVVADKVISLTSNSVNGRFDTNSAGPFNGTITSVTITAGTNSASFYYKDTTVGTPTVTAGAAALTSGIQTEAIVAAGVPSQIGFTTGVQSFDALAVSGIITIQSQDGSAIPANVGAITTITLTSTSATGKFDTNPAGLFNGSITAVVIAGGANTASFYYKDTAAGTPTITVTATGLNAGTQVETINPAAASKVAFTTQPAGAVAGAAFTTQPVVAIQDAGGNTVTTATGNVTLAINPGSGNAGAVLSGSVNLAAVNGVATFTNLSIDLNGNNYVLAATSAGLTSALSNSLNVGLPQQVANISLWSGWNLISPPLMPTNTSTTSVLSGVSGSVISAWAYDAVTGTWASWNPILGGDLTNIVDGKGYWLNMNAAAMLSITGLALPAPPALPPSYTVVPGWNLVGFKKTAPATCAAYFTGTNYRFPVYGFSNGGYVALNSATDNLTQGLGYWVYFNANGSITP